MAHGAIIFAAMAFRRFARPAIDAAIMPLSTGGYNMAKALDFKVANGVLTITVDVSGEAIAAALPSSTGKTRTVASTHGYNWGTGVQGLGFSLTVSAK
jgi:hypothetical protein